MKSSERCLGAMHARVGSRVARLLRAGAAGVLGAVFVCTSALAGTKFIDVVVDPLVPNNASGAPSVSYSGVKAALGQSLNAAYRATLTNASSANINNAWFKVRTSINEGVGPVFVIVPSGCSVDPQVSPAGSGLVCLVSLAASGGTTSITFIIPTPNAPTSGLDSTLKLVWTVQAGQGNSDSNPSNVVQHDSPPIILSLDSSAGLRSYVVNGNGLKVTVGNSNTTVTPNGKDAPVDLKEEINSNSCSAMFKKCFKSTLSIVDPITHDLITFDITNPLWVDLLRDKSTLKGTADINNLNGVLIYSDGVNTYAINQCNGAPGPIFTIPDGADRCYIPNTTPANAFTFVDGSGNWHIRILAKTNGFINW